MLRGRADPGWLGLSCIQRETHSQGTSAMPRDDYDDDDDRPRRARRRSRDDDDYEDIGRRRRSGGGERSGSVTSVGVISIILGSLTLLCGLCAVVGSFTFLAAGPGGQFGGRNVLPFQAAGGVAVIISLVVVIFGVLYLTGGIGVIQRRNWGRIMTLVMAGFSILSGILCLIAVVGMLATPAPIEGKMIGVLIYLLGAFIYFAHGIMAFVVLLSSDNASEFE